LPLYNSSNILHYALPRNFSSNIRGFFVSSYPLDNHNALRYHINMIKFFKCKETQKIFNRDYSRKFPHSIQRIAMRKLWIINAVVNLKDLRIPPSNCLEKLTGKRKGKYSIRINKQWRICFEWHQQDAYQVEIIDYHN